MPKNEHSGKIVSEMLTQLCSDNSIQTPLKFFGIDPKQIRRVYMEFS